MHPELVHREAPSPNWDERALPVGVGALTGLAVDFLTAARVK